MQENNKKLPSQSKPWLKDYPVDIDWHQKMQVQSMDKMFDESVKKFGNKTFLNFMGKKYSYKEIGDMVDSMAKSFQDQGVKPGTKIGLCLPNTPFYVVSYYAALKAGGTVVNFNPLYTESEIKHQIEDSKTDIMVTTNLEIMYPKVAKMLDETCLKKIVTCELPDVLTFPKNWLFKIFKRKEIAKVKKDDRHISYKDMLKGKGKIKTYARDLYKDPAVLQYTGGTTGVPKAAVLTHRNLSSNVNQTKAWFTTAKEGEEKFLAVLPFFHVFAMTVEMNVSMKLGAEIVMLPKFDIDETLKTIKKERPTIFAGVPSLFKKINDYEKTKNYDLTCLKTCVVGGAPLPKEVKEKFDKIAGCNLIEGYGLSETSPLVSAQPLEGKQKERSIGLPVPGTEIRIMNPDLPGEEVEINMKGEICLRGPQIMKEYLGRPDATAETIDKDGFLHTGDIGYMDEDGHTFIVDRIKDMVIINGYNVYPTQVENVIYEHPAIDECIVAGIPSDKTGEVLKAYIVIKQGQELSQADLTAFLKDKLNSNKLPRLIEFRDELPKTMIGKLSRKDLVEEEKAKLITKKPKPNAPKM